MTLQNKNLITTGSNFLKASFRVVKLPSDFPIFFPSTVTILLCIQYFYKWFICNRLALSNFAFVMRKLIFISTAMNIKRLAQIFHRHCATLQMPTWETNSPRTLPFLKYEKHRLFSKAQNRLDFFLAS